MKRTFAIVLLSMGLAIVLAACGSNPIVGTWVEDTDTFGFTFKDDGDASANMYENEMYEFTYRIEGDKLIITYDDTETVNSFVIDGDTLSITNSSGETMEYHKQ